MLDIHRCDATGCSVPVVVGAEFFRIELAPLLDGGVLVSLTATTVDDDEPQLLDQEIASERVTSLDDMLALIKTHVRINSRPRARHQIGRGGDD